MSELAFDSTARAQLDALREHPSAPRFNFNSTDLLNRASLQDVQRFAKETVGLPFWGPEELPSWMPGFLDMVYRQVPYYREFGDAPTDFQAVPSVSRVELRKQVERLIPDDVAFSDITVYSTSGTSGTALAIPTDAGVSSKVLVLIDKLLAPYGLELPRGGGRLALAATFCQEKTLTYPSLSHYLGGAATLKLNLNPGQWNSRTDSREYLEQLAPAVITGCPYSLHVLAEVAPSLRPLALFSSAEALGEGLRRRLDEVFRCPVLDVYSLTEAKFIAVSRGLGEHDLISPDLYVEILDEGGRSVPHGQRGEITLTGGRNRCLPLVRYRTGDFAALAFRGRQPYLTDFQGREPVALVNGQGRPMSSLDVVHALRDFPLVGFTFRQQMSGDYELEYCGDGDQTEMQNKLKEVTGLTGRLVRRDRWEGKPHRFQSASPGGA
jgi:AMP-binding enzyme